MQKLVHIYMRDPFSSTSGPNVAIVVHRYLMHFLVAVAITGTIPQQYIVIALAVASETNKNATM